jgi:hypothetical protein
VIRVEVTQVEGSLLSLMFVRAFGAELPFLAIVVNVSDSNVKWSDPFPRCYRSSYALSILFLYYCFRSWRGVDVGSRMRSSFGGRIWSDVGGAVTIIKFGQLVMIFIERDLIPKEDKGAYNHV